MHWLTYLLKQAHHSTVQGACTGGAACRSWRIIALYTRNALEGAL